MVIATDVTSAPLRILHTAVPDLAGGLERVVQGLAIGQHRRGHEVNVVAIIENDSEDHPFLMPLRDAGVPTTCLRLKHGDYLGHWRGLWRILREYQPDIVHTHGYRSDLMDATAARLQGFPTVTTVHGSSRMGGATHFYEWVQFRVFRWFDAVISVSNPLLALLDEAGVPRDVVETIPNAWMGQPPSSDRREARRTLGLTEDALVVGFVGRLIPIKGCDVLLNAIARLSDLPVVLSIIGDGSERAALEQRATRIDGGKRIFFHGGVDNAAHLYPAFDIYALPSRSEGTPIVLFEAMAAGVPIVASQVGGVPEVLGNTATLVPPENPDALADGLRRVLMDRDGAQRRAEQAKARLETVYNGDVWIDRHETLYSKIRKQNRNSRRIRILKLIRKGGPPEGGRLI
ncbi:MAG: glycosyltransferase [Myxococcota bacterium]|nr:glycosyltransferase [Myxococcota bacterium]